MGGKLRSSFLCLLHEQKLRSLVPLLPFHVVEAQRVSRLCVGVAICATRAKIFISQLLIRSVRFLLALLPSSNLSQPAPLIARKR